MHRQRLVNPPDHTLHTHNKQSAVFAHTHLQWKQTVTEQVEEEVQPDDEVKDVGLSTSQFDLLLLLLSSP